MSKLTPTQRRTLRAETHHQHPVIHIASKGLSPVVLKEIDCALQAHELIKTLGIVRAAREVLLQELCQHLGASAVQHIGSMLIVWRQRPIEINTSAPAVPRKAVARRSKPGAKTRSSRKSR